jgi:two-component system, response regulator PdtaR
VPSSGEPKPVVILIVEDEILVRMSIADILQEAGYHIVEARDGVEALALLEVREDVAAISTDVTMPNMNGMALAKIVSERWPNVGIVVTSGALPAGLSLDLPAGARFVRKPYDPAALLHEISAVAPLSSGSPIALQSIPTMQPGRVHGAVGLAQPLAEPPEK